MIGDEQVSDDVATEPSKDGVPTPVQYARLPIVGALDVETEPVPVIVTAPVAPDMVTPEPATMDVTPEFVIVEPAPTTAKAVQETPDEQETDDVATEESFGGVPLLVVQYERLP